LARGAVEVLGSPTKFVALIATQALGALGG
jgi:hypothetical protein